MKLLFAFSHPDDEVGCLGTIAAHVTRGDAVTLLWLTRGELSEALGPLPTDEVARLREAHGREAAARLGCAARFLEFQDTRIEATPDAAHTVAREIAALQPDVVVTWGDAWARGMRHPDHQATGRIVRDAVTLARIAKVVAPATPHRATAAVFTLRDTLSTLPVRAVDVTAHVRAILDVAAFYRARVGWPDEAWLRARLADAGQAWGVAAAELFDAWETPQGLSVLLLDRPVVAEVGAVEASRT